MTPLELRERRRRAGWSQQKLAFESGVNKAYISEFETGLRPIDIEREYKMAVALAAAKNCPTCGRPL